MVLVTETPKSKEFSRGSQYMGILSYTPELHIACPPTCPVFEPQNQKWVIFVRRRPCVCNTFRFESPPPHRKKDRFWHRLLPPLPRALRKLTFLNVKNDAEQKKYCPFFF